VYVTQVFAVDSKATSVQVPLLSGVVSNLAATIAIAATNVFFIDAHRVPGVIRNLEELSFPNVLERHWNFFAGALGHPWA